MTSFHVFIKMKNKNLVECLRWNFCKKNVDRIFRSVLFVEQCYKMISFICIHRNSSSIDRWQRFVNHFNWRNIRDDVLLIYSDRIPSLFLLGVDLLTPPVWLIGIFPLKLFPPFRNVNDSSPNCITFQCASGYAMRAKLSQGTLLYHVYIIRQLLILVANFQLWHIGIVMFDWLAFKFHIPLHIIF
jgi:hypothetical protein